jgi:hypothetical protein
MIFPQAEKSDGLPENVKIREIRVKKRFRHGCHGLRGLKKYQGIHCGQDRPVGTVADLLEDH